MGTNIKRQHSAEFKTKVAFTAMESGETSSQVAARFSIHPAQVRKWVIHLKQNAQLLFTQKPSDELKQKDQLIEQLYKKIGQREIELDWLKKNMEAID
jgi:transposase